MPSSSLRRSGRRASSDAPLDHAPDNAEIIDALRSAGGIVLDAAHVLLRVLEALLVWIKPLCRAPFRLAHVRNGLPQRKPLWM